MQLAQYAQECKGGSVWLYCLGRTFSAYDFCCACWIFHLKLAVYVTVFCVFLHDWKTFIAYPLFHSVVPSEGQEYHLSSSSDSHTPQRQPPHFWLNEPTAAVPSSAKHCTIIHVFSFPILLHRSVSSSEQACLAPAKAIIYISALQRKHNHCLLWKTKCQAIMWAICFFFVPAQKVWADWPQDDVVKEKES